MYWWIKILGIAFLFACTSSPSDTQREKKAFDLPAYFRGEIKRLSATNRDILKTVSKGNASETKTIQVDWETELAAFASIDLNKPVYAGYIRKDSSDNVVTFRMDNPAADISTVHIRYNEDDEPSEITIHKKTDNLLYETIETLYYRRNESYRIEKQQDVWLLGTNHYSIVGSLK